jgi:hypothetical protein
MIDNQMAGLFERSLRKLIKEINLFSREEDLWVTQESVKISCGNLVSRIIESTNHFFATTISNSGNMSDFDRECIGQRVGRKTLVFELEKLILKINETFDVLTSDLLEADYPISFDNKKRSTSYVLMRVLIHLNYHLGQVNYLRRHFNKTKTTSILNVSLLLEKLYQN